jgi:hypothetical protein
MIQIDQFLLTFMETLEKISLGKSPFCGNKLLRNLQSIFYMKITQIPLSAAFFSANSLSKNISKHTKKQAFPFFIPHFPRSAILISAGASTRFPFPGEKFPIRPPHFRNKASASVFFSSALARGHSSKAIFQNITHTLLHRSVRC